MPVLRNHRLTIAVAVVTAGLVATPATAAKFISKKQVKKNYHTKQQADARYPQRIELATSDGTPPNQGSNLVHWDVLAGLPGGFADGTDDTGGTAAPSWLLAGNAGTDPSTEFVGTTDEQALNLRVNNARALRLEPDPTSPSVIGGFSGNQASGSGATIGGGGQAGFPNAVTNDFGTVGGGQGNTASGADTVSGGQFNTASGGVATVSGGQVNTASDIFATVGGGQFNTASGIRATVGGGESNTAGGGGATVGGGESNTAGGGGATVGGGQFNTAGGGSSTAGGGAGNTASGLFSTVPGGTGGVASLHGQMAHASGSFGVSGDAQTSEYVLRRVTTDATPTELLLDGVTPTSRLTLASGRTHSFDVLVVARTANAGGQSAGYRVTGLIENVGGTTTFVGSPAVTVLGEDNPAWDLTVEADNTNDALVLKGTGAAATTIRWVAMVQTAEVLFG